jgi:dTDP-4-amino-4,6-dideoxygalactose transaminase
LRVTPPANEINHSYYKYYVFVRPERLREGWNRDRIMAAINAEGIPCFSGICSEIYLERAFPEQLRPQKRMAVARELGETSLMFLVHPTLSEQDMLDTCHAVEKVMNAAGQ